MAENTRHTCDFFVDRGYSFTVILISAVRRPPAWEKGRSLALKGLEKLLIPGRQTGQIRCDLFVKMLRYKSDRLINQFLERIRSYFGTE